MTNIELIMKLRLLEWDYDISINTPDRQQNFFIDNATIDHENKQIFIETAK